MQTIGDQARFIDEQYREFAEQLTIEDPDDRKTAEAAINDVRLLWQEIERKQLTAAAKLQSLCPEPEELP